MTESVKIKCDDCKFVEDCVDYGWDADDIKTPPFTQGLKKLSKQRKDLMKRANIVV